LDEFDRLLKSKVKNEKWRIPDNFDNKLDRIFSNLPNIKLHKKNRLSLTIAVVLISVLTTTTVLAANSAPGENIINNVILYFNSNSDSKYIGDQQALVKFSSGVGITTEDKGIKFTVDSIAVDDNFLDIFYTIQSDKPIPRGDNNVFSGYFAAPTLNYKLNGNALKRSNNNDMEAYLESDYKLIGMSRENLSLMKIPSKLKLDINANAIFNIKGNWSISTEVDVSKAKENTKTITPNQKASIKLNDGIDNITIDKVVISPLGNQIIISEDYTSINSQLSNFALFDEKGEAIEVLSSDLVSGNKGKGKSTNVFEFIKTNKDTKELTLVPLIASSELKQGPIAEINKFPFTLKLWDKGSIVVDDIAFTKNQLKITYHNEGIVVSGLLLDSTFYDKEGKEVQISKGEVKSSVDRKNGRHSETYTSYSSSCDFSKIAKISTFVCRNIELLYDKQIKIDLTK